LKTGAHLLKTPTIDLTCGLLALPRPSTDVHHWTRLASRQEFCLIRENVHDPRPPVTLKLAWQIARQRRVTVTFLINLRVQSKNIQTCNLGTLVDIKKLHFKVLDL